MLLAVLGWTGALWYGFALAARGILPFEPSPLFILVGAVGMVVLTGIFVFREGGLAALRRWLTLSITARVPSSAYLAALIPAALMVLVTVSLPLFGVRSVFGPVISVGLIGILIPVWIEETVWRGYALPRLLEIHTPVVASAVLAGVWVVWHIPFYLMPGYNAWGMGGWLAWLPFYVVYTFFLTWLGVKARFSVLLAVLSHFAVNWTVSSSNPSVVENYLALWAALLLAPITALLFRRLGR